MSLCRQCNDTVVIGESTMIIKQARGVDWWRHQFYRHIKAYLSNPSEEQETQLRTLLQEYRQFHAERRDRPDDEHEWVMDFR